MPCTLDLERQYEGIVAGIDEAGRGPWAGPVVAAAVILPAEFSAAVDDSKKLTAKKRENLFQLICAEAKVGVGISTVAEIDTLNILNATKLAMKRAVEVLPVLPAIALVDGNSAPLLPCPVKTVIDGDALSMSIAAASIVAKVTRDKIMAELAEMFPGYGWEKNAGYGTASHQQAMSLLGITPHHRRSYAPVKTMLSATNLLGHVEA